MSAMEANLNVQECKNDRHDGEENASEPMAKSQENLNSQECKSDRRESEREAMSIQEDSLNSYDDETQPQDDKEDLTWFDAKRFLPGEHGEHIFKAITMSFQFGNFWMRAHQKNHEHITDKKLGELLDMSEGTISKWKKHYTHWESFEGWAAHKGRPKNSNNDNNDNIDEESGHSVAPAVDTATSIEQGHDKRVANREKQTKSVPQDAKLLCKHACKTQGAYSHKLNRHKFVADERIMAAMENKDYYVIYIDDTRGELGEKDHKKYWSYAGTPAYVYGFPTQSKFTLLSACSKDKAILSHVFKQKTSEESFNKYLQEMLSVVVQEQLNTGYEHIDGKRKKVEKQIVLVMDTSLAHNQLTIRDTLDKYNAKAYYYGK